MDGTAKLWDVETGREIRTFSGHTKGVISVAISSDSKRVATGSEDNLAKLWDVETGKETHTYSDHMGPVTSVAFSPIDNKLFTSGRGIVLLWKITDLLNVKSWNQY